MSGRIKGETKMEIARRVVRELITALPANTQLGLVAYGHRKAGDCQDIELLIAPGTLDKERFVKAVEALEPRGMTPLSAALEFAAQALKYRESKASIVLVSDGLETCNKDPCATARALKAAGADLTAHVVAFDLSAKEARAIECIASETGGRFLQANDAASLKDALEMVVAEATVPAAPTPTPDANVTATMKAPGQVIAGATFQVEWTGPDRQGDFITIVPKGAPDGSYVNYTYTRRGSPLTLTALIEPGPAEVRYVQDRPRKTLATADLQVELATVSVTAADETVAGAPVAVTWTGPANAGDYITIVPKGAPDSDYAKYTNVRAGSPTVPVIAPIETSDAEIRYVSGQGRKVLARRPLKVVTAAVTLSASEKAVSGSLVEIAWAGPNNAGDYITIVTKGTPDGKYAGYKNVATGSPLSVPAPMEAGEAEIRYVSGQGSKVLARRPLVVAAAEVSLSAPDQVVAGAAVPVVWTGPNNPGDYITIVAKSLPDGRYDRYATTTGGSPLNIPAIMTPGEAEIRYMSGQGAKVLARRPLKVVAAVVTLNAPARVPASAPVAVDWTGPNNNGDYLTIVAKGSPDGTYGRTVYTRAGSPAKMTSPKDPGQFEIRYLGGQGNQVLARRDVTVTAP